MMDTLFAYDSSRQLLFMPHPDPSVPGHVGVHVAFLRKVGFMFDELVLRRDLPRVNHGPQLALPGRGHRR